MEYKKLILIDHITIGNLTFTAYVLENEDKHPAFAIFLDKQEEPFVLFNPILDSNNIRVTVEKKLFEYMNQQKSNDIKLRRKYIKIFMNFMAQSEAKAKNTFFKDKEMTYIEDTELMNMIKDSYLYDAKK